MYRVFHENLKILKSTKIGFFMYVKTKKAKNYKKLIWNYFKCFSKKKLKITFY